MYEDYSDGGPGSAEALILTSVRTVRAGDERQVSTLNICSSLVLLGSFFISRGHADVTCYEAFYKYQARPVN